MSPELSVQPNPAELAPKRDILVLAKDPVEMAQAHEGLKTWIYAKVAEEETNLAEIETNLAQAKQLKIRTAGWKRQSELATKRVEYYRKVQAAIEEGYHIVPNFPADFFAVRTHRKAPPRKEIKGRWGIPAIKTAMLPKGEGKYVSTEPLTKQDVRQIPSKAGGTYDEVYTTPIAFLPVDFPLKLVKPQILQELSLAMKSLIFDEIGILPWRRQRKGDPMLIGTIKRMDGAHEHRISFLITWWIDTRDL